MLAPARQRLQQIRLPHQTLVPGKFPKRIPEKALILQAKNQNLWWGVVGWNFPGPGRSISGGGSFLKNDPRQRAAMNFQGNGPLVARLTRCYKFVVEH
jgi:hypothetical protein